MSSERLLGRTCVVTGAARGIGFGIAERLARDGARVCIADVDGDAADTAAARIAEAGGEATAVACDVTDRASVRGAIEHAASAFAPIDVMFNNAGVTQAKQFLEITEDEWRRILDVNALGTLIGMQEAARHMIENEKAGQLVNTASIAGKQGFPLVAHYSASKFAAIGLTQAGARALAPHGITANALCPGVVDTELWQHHDLEFIEAGETERPGQAFEEFSASILLGRVAQPSDVAALASFLASEDARYMTGQSINIDGGMVLS